MKFTVPSYCLLLCLSARWTLADHPGIPDGLAKAAPLSRFKNFAVLGDSYAAGIGAGEVLKGEDDKKCSRYDEAYGFVLNKLADGKPDFQFKACSGDTSADIKKQVSALKDKSQDLVTMSAGGNDALLSEILKDCIFLPTSDEKCDEALGKSRKVIDGELQGNIKSLLKLLDGKVKDGGVVLYTLYATFFNSETDPCDHQTWNMLEGIIPIDNGMKLTKDLRRKLNKLVTDANAKIASAIKAFGGGTDRIKVMPVAWDEYAVASKGRFCEIDQKEEERLFFQTEPAGFIPPERSVKKKQRDLQKRVPDSIGRLFHPTPLGHDVITTYAILALFRALAPPKECKKKEKPGPKPDAECEMDWASALPYNVFRSTFQDFCKRADSNIIRPLTVTANSKGDLKPPPLVVQDPNHYPFPPQKRTPPPNPNAYKDVKIQFTWRPTVKGACKLSCTEAFESITSSPCKFHTPSSICPF